MLTLLSGFMLSSGANAGSGRGAVRVSARTALGASLFVLLSWSCTKKAPDGQSGAADAASAAEAVPAAEAATPTGAGAETAVDAERQALGRAYPVLRCALTGASMADDGLWQQNGFASPSAFAAAWSKAAAADPAWARSVVSTALRTPCANPAAGAAPPAAATPADAPAAVAP